MNQSRTRRAEVVVAAFELALGEQIVAVLSSMHVSVKHAQTLGDALAILDDRIPDLVVLADDLGTPCTEASTRIREYSKVPILVLCGDTSSEHAALALLSGADDHIRKDVSADELRARAWALLRRNQVTSNVEFHRLEAGPLKLDDRRGTCSVNGNEVQLTPREFKLLRALASRAGDVLTYEQLIEEVWGSPYHGGRETLRKLVQRLRARLAADLDSNAMIQAVAGAGYRLAIGNKDRDDDELRSHILTATRRCLSARGFQNLTIDDVCRVSHAPRSVLYRHFRNKDTLLNEVVQRSNHETLSALQAFAESGDGSSPVARIIDFIASVFAAPTIHDAARYNLEWWAWATRNVAGLEGFRETRREWRDALTSLLRAELGDGPSEEDVQAMANLMLLLFYGLVVHATLEGDDLDIEVLMRLQQYGWEGIFERVRAGAPVETPKKPARRSAAARRAAAGE